MRTQAMCQAATSRSVFNAILPPPIGLAEGLQRPEGRKVTRDNISLVRLTSDEAYNRAKTAVQHQLLAGLRPHLPATCMGPTYYRQKELE